MNISVLNQVGGGVGEYRVTTPHVFLSNSGHNVKFISDLSKPIDTEILFIHISSIVNSSEEHFINMFNNILALKKRGVKIVVDIDDYWVLPIWHSLFNLSRSIKNNTPYANRHIKVFQNVDHITTTTKFLLNEIYKYTKKVTILPNSLDESFISNKKDNTNNDRFKIIWGGSSTHIHDIKLIDRSGIMSKMNKLKGQFILGGFNTMVRMPDGEIMDSPEQSEWPKYEKIITNNYKLVDKNYANYLIKYDKTPYYTSDVPYLRRWAKDVKNYLNIFSDVHVVLAPLVNDPFNKAKSELKIIEAGWNKKPIICSNIQQYNDVLNKGGGLVFDNSSIHKDLMKFILIYKNNNNKLIDDGETLYEICKRDFNLIKTNEKRIHLYQSLI